MGTVKSLIKLRAARVKGAFGFLYDTPSGYCDRVTLIFMIPINIFLVFCAFWYCELFEGNSIMCLGFGDLFTDSLHALKFILTTVNKCLVLILTLFETFCNCLL